MSISHNVRRHLDDLTEDKHFVEFSLRKSRVSGIYKGLKKIDKKWYIMLASTKSSMMERVQVDKITDLIRVEDYSLFG